MTQPFATDTERIFDRLARLRAEFVAHPFLTAARTFALPLPVLIEFATYQYADSVLWIPMLALMRSRVTRSTVLVRSIEANIACEAGLSGTSHVALAAALLRSLDGAPEHVRRCTWFNESATEWLADAFAAMSEPAVAGWLLVAESLVPVMFAAVQPCFERVPGCDVAYFREHVQVDEAEHADWMARSVRDVLALHERDEGVRGVLAGMDAAWAEVLEVPSLLHAKRGE